MRLTLTKKLALQLLDNQTDEQRNLCWQKVHSYKRLMNYQLFGFRENSPLGFTQDNKLKNGQHRVMAFLLSNLNQIEFEIEYN